MAILDSIKKLGRKMTGSPVQGTDIESAIDSIADNYSGGSGGANLIIMRVDYGPYEANMSFDEMVEKITSGAPVNGVFTQLFDEQTGTPSQKTMIEYTLDKNGSDTYSMIIMRDGRGSNLYWDKNSGIADD